jgi:hypothetical protein
VAHRCRVLPVEALKAEASGDRLGAVRMLAAHASGGPLQEHGGVWKRSPPLTDAGKTASEAP